MIKNREKLVPVLPEGVRTLADSVKNRMAAGESAELVAGRCWMDGWAACELMLKQQKLS